MAKIKRDEIREQRIIMEIVVDAYGAEEQAMGWYYYLEDTIKFPFLAKCIARRTISPLRVGDEIEIYALAPEGECSNEIFVMMPREKDGLAVPLMQLEVIHGNKETEEAVNDWKYWVARGYSFG